MNADLQRLRKELFYVDLALAGARASWLPRGWSLEVMMVEGHPVLMASAEGRPSHLHAVVHTGARWAAAAARVALLVVASAAWASEAAREQHDAQAVPS